jgi:hypothetical protein
MVAIAMVFLILDSSKEVFEENDIYVPNEAPSAEILHLIKD